MDWTADTKSHRRQTIRLYALFRFCGRRRPSDKGREGLFGLQCRERFLRINAMRWTRCPIQSDLRGWKKLSGPCCRRGHGKAYFTMRGVPTGLGGIPTRFDRCHVDIDEKSGDHTNIGFATQRVSKTRIVRIMVHFLHTFLKWKNNLTNKFDFFKFLRNKGVCL